MATFRSTTVTSTSTLVNKGSTRVTIANIVNRHSAAIFVKFYNQTIATFQDTPIRVIQAGANATVQVDLAGKVVIDAPTALCIRVTTGVNDNDNTAAATLPIIELTY